MELGDELWKPIPQTSFAVNEEKRVLNTNYTATIRLTENVENLIINFFDISVTDPGNSDPLLQIVMWAEGDDDTLVGGYRIGNGALQCFDSDPTDEIETSTNSDCTTQLPALSSVESENDLRIIVRGRQIEITLDDELIGYIYNQILDNAFSIQLESSEGEIVSFQIKSPISPQMWGVWGSSLAGLFVIGAIAQLARRK